LKEEIEKLIKKQGEIEMENTKGEEDSLFLLYLFTFFINMI
jgi:hypothetical protein